MSQFASPQPFDPLSPRNDANSNNNDAAQQGGEHLVPPLDVHERLKRRREGILIAVLLLVFLVLFFIEFRLVSVSSTLPFVTSIFFFGLLNINIVILMGLVWLVSRNIGKLFIERRRTVFGARLKTKLVIAFLAFSIIPTLVLFFISAIYINSSFDKWFSLKIQNTLQASLEITHTYYRNTESTAFHFAHHLAASIAKRIPPPSLIGPRPAMEWIGEYLQTQRELLACDGVEYYGELLGERVMAQRPFMADFPMFYPRLALESLEKAFGGESVSLFQHLGTGDLVRCLVPIHAPHPAGAAASAAVLGVMVVDSYIPVSLQNKVNEITNVVEDYRDTNPLKYPMKTTYFVILIMITLVIIFVAIWIGLYMARELTVPVERLALGAAAVGAGNLDISILATGHDEITVLVNSFNKMTRDLRESRKSLIQTGADLEKRRLQLEAVLAHIATGVVVVDHLGEITTFNPAVAELLEITPEKAYAQHFSQVLVGDYQVFSGLIERAFHSARAAEVSQAETGQWTIKVGKGLKVLAAVATFLRETENHWGVVLVIDDMTHLIKGQREMAWQEVARRIAHEIKNPLTPIKLSAQRLQRRFLSYSGRDGDLMRECTETIIKHTDELKEMVNEFSNFARFPEVSPAPNDLNAALQEVVSLFQQGHTEMRIVTQWDQALPVFEFDRDQIKRVMINLFDNAVAALRDHQGGSGKKQIRIASQYHSPLQMAIIEIEDNGCGMSESVKSRVFEPYFSTKLEGTGLGLAIVKRIINDHDGFIRVRSDEGKGTLFLIELPTKRHV